MLLAIDTATQHISLALHDGDAVTAEQTWHSPNNHTIELAPAVSVMLARANLTIDALTHLAVCVGPGSYSALRIGVAFAKGLASVRKIPLCGVNTFDIAARAFDIWQDDGGRDALMITAQAGRGRVLACRYQYDSEHWTRYEAPEGEPTEPELYDWDALMDVIQAMDQFVIITGEVDGHGREVIQTRRDQLGNHARFWLAPPALRMRRAAHLADAAWEQFRTPSAKREAFNAAAVKPVYIKTKDSP